MSKFSDANYETLTEYFDPFLTKRTGDQNTYIMGQRRGIIAKGGLRTTLWQLNDNGDYIAHNFKIISIDGNYFEFEYTEMISDHSEATPLEVDKEIYFRNDSRFHEWLRINWEEYEDVVNPNRTWLYFGRIYERSGPQSNIYYIIFRGLKDWGMEAMPVHQRTDRMYDLAEIYFDQVYHGIYNLTKTMWSFMESREVYLKHLWYMADRYSINIDERMEELRLREWTDNLVYWLKRKGTYTAYYIVWKLLFGNTINKLNIYERWADWCDYKISDIPRFKDYHILEYYGVHPSGGSGDYWYSDYDPANYPTHAEEPPAGGCDAALDDKIVGSNLFNYRDFRYEDSDNRITALRRYSVEFEKSDANEDLFGSYTHTSKAISAGGFSYTCDMKMTEIRETTSDHAGMVVWQISNNMHTHAVSAHEYGTIWLSTDRNLPGNTQYNMFAGETYNFTRQQLIYGTYNYDVGTDYTWVIETNQPAGTITFDSYENGIVGNHCETITMTPSGDRDYVYLYNLNHLRHSLEGEWTSGIVSNMSDGYTTEPALNTETPVITPHYRVELDLSSEPMGPDYIINEYYSTELVRYWDYVKPVAKYIHYDMVIAPLGALDKYGEWVSLYSTDYSAYCDTRFTGETTSPAATASAYGSLYGSDEFGDNTFVFNQPVGTSTWRIEHGLDSDEIIVQAYDNNGNLVIPDNIEIESKDFVNLTFSSSVRGTAFVAALKYWNREFTVDTPTTTWDITHGYQTSGADGIVYEIYEDDKDAFKIAHSVNVSTPDHMIVEWSDDDSVAETGVVPMRDEDYIYEQLTGSTVWYINHNLDCGGHIINVYDNNGDVVYPDSIEIINSNNTQITFSESVYGTAVFVYFPKDYEQDNVMDLLEYWKIGDESPEGYDPVSNNDLYSPTYSGLIDEVIETDDKYYVRVTVDKDINAGVIQEVGLFNSEDEIMFYTKMSTLWKTDNVKLTVWYRIDKQ